MNDWQKRSSGHLGGGAPLPSTPIADALARGMGDTGRIGNSFTVTSQAPFATFTAVNGFNYLWDLRPDSQGGRNIEVAGDPVYSSQTTLVASYRPANDLERNSDPGIGDGHYVNTPLRDFRAQISFGAGTAQQSVECDISEGIAMSLPGQSVTLAVYSTFFMRGGDPGFNTQFPLNCQAHLASGLATRAGQVTDRVFAPYQTPVDLLDPPTIEAHLSNLIEALCNRSYLATGPGEGPAL